MNPEESNELWVQLHQNNSLMRQANRNWRRGQTFFNALHVTIPELAEEIRSTSLDPFYKDENVEACLQKVKEYLFSNNEG